MLGRLAAPSIVAGARRNVTEFFSSDRQPQ
jgi:hypothetical protein